MKLLRNLWLVLVIGLAPTSALPGANDPLLLTLPATTPTGLTWPSTSARTSSIAAILSRCF